MTIKNWSSAVTANSIATAAESATSGTHTQIQMATAIEGGNMVRMIDADAIEHCLVIGGRRHGKTIISEIIRRAIQSAPTVDAIPVVWIKEWVEEIKDHPAYTEEEKTLCIEEFEDMLGAWAERKDE